MLLLISFSQLGFNRAFNILFANRFNIFLIVDTFAHLRLSDSSINSINCLLTLAEHRGGFNHITLILILSDLYWAKQPDLPIGRLPRVPPMELTFHEVCS